MPPPSRTSRRLINPLDLEIEQRPTGTVLVYHGEPLETPEGRLIVDEASHVIEVVLDDLRTFRQLMALGRRLELPAHLTCYEIHVRRQQKGTESSLVTPVEWGKRDPLLTGTPKDLPEFEEIQPVLECLMSNSHSVESWDTNSDGWASGVWKDLDDVQRAVAGVLVYRHTACFAVAVAFAWGCLSTRQYGRAVWRIRERTDQVFRRCHAAQQHEYFDEVRRDAWKAERYLNSRMDQLEALFMKGESATLEFKTTLRKNIRTGKADKAILNANLKTIVGFLNTEGGMLAIGVTDDGDPADDVLALDEIGTEDKYLRHLFSKLRDTVGGAMSSAVTARFEKFRGSSVCVVRCSRSLLPVFVVLSKGTEEFFVRNGPSTESLSIREAVRYIRKRFPEYNG